MKKFTIFFAIAVACAMGAPATPALEAIRKLPALDHEEIHDQLGQYSLRYVTAEGTIVTEKGSLIPNPNGEGMVMVVEGEVSYVGDDGQIYNTKYTAGVDGVKVVSSHSPAAVSVPPVVEVAAVPVSSVAEVSAVPIAPEVEAVEVAAEPSVEVSAVPLAPAVEAVEVAATPSIEVSAVPSIEVAALPSVEIAAIPARSVVEVAAIPPAPLLPPLPGSVLVAAPQVTVTAA